MGIFDRRWGKAGYEKVGVPAFRYVVHTTFTRSWNNMTSCTSFGTVIMFRPERL